ncbi:MAG TPA: hypothetical protein P5260_08280 [Candidatus Competibacter sp.]|jgi:hypothetical protein|nr:hypothetical protein [Candidatus Competibacter sp.]HRF62781.1 hypothetical protein [Candidatus Competibacter sp.]HRX61199.1 hypothetical protein [Candidatus Competibacter sp.]
MESPNLFLVCLNAFAAVLGLLWVLAIALRGLIELFPEKPAPQTDAAVAVAIAAAATAIVPGARVTRIEEIR